MSFGSSNSMKDRGDYLTIEQIKLLKEEAIKSGKRARNYVLLNVLEYTACRVSEVLHIRVKDLFFDENIIQIGRLKQRRKIREELVMDSKLKDILEEYVYANNLAEDKYLVYGYTNKCQHCKDGRHLSRRQVNNVIKKLAVEVGIGKRVHVHQYRHSWIVNKIKNGSVKSFDDMRKASKFMGHASILITEKYWDHFGDSEMKQFINPKD